MFGCGRSDGHGFSSKFKALNHVSICSNAPCKINFQIRITCDGFQNIVVFWLSPSGTIQIHQMNPLDTYPLKGLRNLKGVMRDDLLGGKVASLKPHTLAVDQPNGRNDFKHSSRKMKINMETKLADLNIQSSVFFESRKPKKIAFIFTNPLKK